MKLKKKKQLKFGYTKLTFFKIQEYNYKYNEISVVVVVVSEVFQKNKK
jgi:hypothetical protein